MITNFEANKKDTHLQNILRQVNEEFRTNNVIMAFILFGVLTKYLEGLDMEGNPWPKPLPSEETEMLLIDVKAYNQIIEKLSFIEDGCLVPPDGGSPTIHDAMKTAKDIIQILEYETISCD